MNPIVANSADPAASDRSLWGGYLALAIAANLAFLSFKGYQGDIRYWADWVRELAGGGYANYSGNYPPVFVHWLWLVSRPYRWTGQPVEPTLLMKYLAQIPVLLAHVGLLRLCFGYVRRSGGGRLTRHGVMAFTALNPALLVDGPAWGQVDLLPAFLVCLALHCALERRRAHWALPLLTVSLLTKFQMIAFLPIFGVLVLRQVRRHLVGAALSAAVAGAVFLPFLLAGHATQAFRQAYVDTLGQYPVATLNAANVWILLIGNFAPDSRAMFGTRSGPWSAVFTARQLGMLCFGLLALVVFAFGLARERRLARAAVRTTADASGARPGPSPDRERPFAYLAATLCATGFFAFLPAMHERYLLPAVVVALAHLALTRAGALIPVGVSLVSTLNMLLVVELNGSDLWRGLSWALCGLLALSLLDLVTEHAASRGLIRVARLVLAHRHFTLVVLPTSILAMLLLQISQCWIREPRLGPRRHLLTDYPVVSARQDLGALRFNSSFDGHGLSVGNERHAAGLGTHANSWLEFRLPPDAVSFSCIPGVDDEVGNTELAFSILGDGRTLWGPTTYWGNEGAAVVKVDVQGVERLVLKVDALQDDRYDHADWIDPIVELRQ